jgi:aldehyde:ferredoxin oxidoreductase
MRGYFNRFLKVDLTTASLEDLPLRDDDLRDYVGGSTLAARMIYDHVGPGMNPLAPENPLIFATGPFIGSKIPMVSRAVVCGIAPGSGLWGEATTGGRFPVRLKSTGYDGLLITGKAEKPVCLVVAGGKAEIRPAERLWGKDTYATQAMIAAEVGERASAACIGAGGEKLIRYAGIVNDDGRTAGRCGLGALMGAKNLKAVVVSGTRRPEVADEERVKRLVEETRECIRSFPNANGYRLYGTNMYMDLGMRLGDVPAKYFTKSVFPAEKLHGPAFRTRYRMASDACAGCPIGCGRVIKDFSPEIRRVDGPEYETVAAFGPLCMNFDIDSIVRANHFCNLHGIDSISAGVSIAFAMHLYEKGVLTEKEAGMEIRWGDPEVILRLLESIIAQEGIGAVLSGGVREMAAAFGADPEEAAHVKGLEFPMHDSRAYQGAALAYAVGPRGACHLKGSLYSLDAPGNESALELGISFSNKNDPVQKGAMTAKLLQFCEIYNSFTLCQFSPMTAPMIARGLAAITGMPVGTMDLLTFGERSLNLKRAINNRLGVTRKDDRLPRIVRQALKEGATAGIEPSMEIMLREFYEVSGWDLETGKPTRERLVQLGLEQAANDLWG